MTTTKQTAYAPAPELIGRCFQTSQGPVAIIGQNERGMMLLDRGPDSVGPNQMSPSICREALARSEIVADPEGVLAAANEATEWLKTLSL